jgi:hypothetical protein
MNALFTFGGAVHRSVDRCQFTKLVRGSRVHASMIKAPSFTLFVLPLRSFMPRDPRDQIRDVIIAGSIQSISQAFNDLTGDVILCSCK